MYEWLNAPLERGLKSRSHSGSALGKLASVSVFRMKERCDGEKDNRTQENG